MVTAAKSATPPSSGGDERTFITKMADVRLAQMKAYPNEFPSSAWGRVPGYKYAMTNNFWLFPNHVVQVKDYSSNVRIVTDSC